MRRSHAAIALLLSICVTAQARATNIDDWSGVNLPPAPMLREFHANPTTTALLVLDFMTSNCGKKQRCVATELGVAKLIKDAKLAHAMVIYSFTRGKTAADVVAALTPTPDIPVIIGGPDKFLGTDLDALLKRAGIKTVIVTGTGAEGAVIATASQAAYRGLKVILPVDGISSDNPFAEKAVVWILTNGATTRTATIPTSLVQIHFDGR